MAVESSTLAAQDAAEALIALGFPVLPHGPDMDRWQIGDLIWTDDELMGLAARQGYVPAADRLQQAVDLADVPPLRGKQLAALRGVAATPGGLRITAYPSAMPLLVRMGLVEERSVPAARHREGRGWFLTAEGRATVGAYGLDDG